MLCVEIVIMNLNGTDIMKQKLYAERDAIALGQLYVDHVCAMTGEALHEKSDIAAELAWRDARIQMLQENYKKAKKALEFYARCGHAHLDPNEGWDTVSGEGTNILFSGIEDSESFVEDGSYAKHVLDNLEDV